MQTKQTWKIGNCLELLPEIPDKSIDLIVTSPPYFNVKEYSHWDTYEEYLIWMRNVFTEAYRILVDGRMCCVNIGVILEPRLSRQNESKRRALPFHFVNVMENIGFKFLEDILWIKPSGSSKNRSGRFSKDRQPIQYKPDVINEYILVFQKPMVGLIDDVLRKIKKDVKKDSLIHGDYDKTNVWYINPDTTSPHPAPFPIEIPLKLIRYYSFIHEIVLDMFVGCGTTLEACMNTNRNCIGFEISDEWEPNYRKRLRLDNSKLTDAWNSEVSTDA